MHPTHSNRRARRAGLVLVFAIAATPLAQVRAGEIRWRSGTAHTAFRTSAETAQTMSNLRAQSVTPEPHVVVQFDRPLNSHEKAELAASGVRLLNYVGDNAYFAALTANGVDATRLSAVQPLRVVRPVERDWKLHPSLVADEIFDWAVVAAGDKTVAAEEDDNPTVAAYVLFHRDVALLTDGVQAVQSIGGRIRSTLQSVNGLVIELPATQIKVLAEDDRVQYIEPPLPKFSELNDSNRAITGADIVQAAPYDLDGTGVKVLVYDGGYVRATHVDFGGRATVRDTSGLSDHSTHVAGTIGGDGTASGGLRRGMAPNVTIESYGFEQPGGLSQGFLYTDPGDIEADYSEAISVHGVDISNNSIGTNTAPNGYPCEWEGDYGVTSTVIETIVRGDGSNPLFTSPFRIVWANGNERGSGRCGTTYLTTAPPACAKNHITVGALNSNNDTVTSFTSWGPTDDGRIKPDISGPGCQSDGDFGVTSLSSSGDTAYTDKCGTSMAAPTITGLAALFLQDFRVQFPGEPDPRNSTLKAIFAHTAEDIVNVGPDYQSGYGSVRIERAINLMRAENFLEDSSSQGATFTAIVIVSPGDNELKVTLAWDDVPGTPNVSPALVNDLDLHVYAPNNTRHFPWTLNPASGATPAVRTTEDHANNIEQVVVDNPTPGAWRVEIHGFNVPQGPQPFSLSASPLLVKCGDAGIVNLDRTGYNCSSTATVRVVDCGLNTSDSIIDTVTVNVSSTTDGSGESIVLVETAAESATFLGTVMLSTTNSAGVVQVAEGDTVTATYIDADDGNGGTNITVTADASVDCTAPQITSVQTSNILPRSATVTFNTDDAAVGTVRYGSSCGSLTQSASGSGLNLAHTIVLNGLTDSTTYFYAVDAADAANNVSTDNAGGACYAFSTPDIPDFFTEQFVTDNDLAFKMLTFTPNATVDQYDGCVEDITDLPTDPSGGTSVTLDDDDNIAVTVSGNTVSLYGVSYSQFYLISNGYVTFGTLSEEYNESFAEHFSIPRVSAVFDDLNPEDGGTISWKQLADRIAVTWEDIPQYNTNDQNTFQIELFFDGTIRISYLDLDVVDGIAGLSAGNGIDPDFLESDLSAMGNCGPQPPIANSSSVATDANVGRNITLNALDDGLPDPPAALDYIINTLPTKGTLTDPNAGVISSVPFTLASNGNVVTYDPLTNLYGPDQFNFIVNDGGTPPEGGDSNTGIISITILADPPTAYNVNANIDINTAGMLALVATDPNDPTLDYVITSLPAHGTLTDPNGGTVAAVPYTLASQGNLVEYSPDTDYAGPDGFDYKAKDAIFESNEASVTVLVVAGAPVITSDVLLDGVAGMPYGPVSLENSGGQPATSWSLVTDLIYVEEDLGSSLFQETGVAQGWRGDDIFNDFTLPFEFPFYGNVYSEVRVSANGFLNFGPYSGSAFVNTLSGLIANRRIAPLWDDLKTTGPGEDIFIDTSEAGQITIRWKGHAAGGDQGVVDVAVTLYDDGDIVFHYGSTGNTLTPTVGISNGSSGDYAISAYDGLQSFSGLNSVRIHIPITLPDGLSINSNGVISGTPTTTGHYQPLVRLDDSLARSDQKVLSLTVVSDAGAPGDYDGDGDADLIDYAVLVNCLYGPNVAPSPLPSATTQSCLAVFDVDDDGDVDLEDVAILAPAYGTP